MTMNIEALVTELFDEFDRNGDGQISRGEFVALIESLLDKRELGFSSDIFKKFDANHDNRISREELVDLIVELAI
mgnify:CR=1 FL=1